MKLFKSKSGKEGMMGWVILAVALFIAYNSGLLSNFGSGPTQGTTPPDNGGSTSTTPPIPTITLKSDCTQGTTLTSSMIRRHTDVTQGSENVTVIQNGVEKVTINNGGTTTIQSGQNGDMLDLYPALQSTTFYAQHITGKVTTCTASATTGDPNYFSFKTDESPGGKGITYADFPNKVVQIADTVVIDIVNDGQANSQTNLNEVSGENLSIGTGSTGSVSLKFKVDYNEGWGTTGGNIMACQFPGSVYDAATPLAVTVAGLKLEETDKKPSNTRYVLYQSNNTVKAFKFPGIDGRLTPVVDGTMVIRASSNNDPANNLDRINCTVFDTNYYKRQADGKYVLDTENRDTNADVGGANTIFDFVVGVE